MRSVLTVMAMLISVAVFAQAGEKNFIDKNYIGVTDKSKLEFTPDKIYIQVLLSEKDKQGRNSVAEQ
ncbi:MAG TPA: hypothetical protein VL098_06560 [Flavipsychrobacter sp.]|nr:hypothetical protein [Flavipsychrobacter sp.]